MPSFPSCNRKGAVCGLAFAITVTLSAAEIRVNDFGAKGDATTFTTNAIQNALDAAARSGATVVFSPGIYLTGALFVKSGTRLRLDAGVELHAIQEQSAYPVMTTRVAGIEMNWPAALLNVYEQSNATSAGRALSTETESTGGTNTGVYVRNTIPRDCAGRRITIANVCASFKSISPITSI